MNFVICSYHFLPMAGAESYCTTRFASALARAGHRVKVVTMDWSHQVSRRVYDALVDSRLEIIRVPVKRDMKKPPFWARLAYLTHEYDAVDISALVKTLKATLRATEHPILISRTHPITSMIAALGCRAYADKWIAHFSDPIPMYGTCNLNVRTKSWMAKRWVTKAMRCADGFSFTCDNAARFYEREYGVSLSGRYVVATHIGDPPLEPVVPSGKKNEVPEIVHVGLLYPNRGSDEVIAAVKRLNARGVACRFAQIGEVDRMIVDSIGSDPSVRFVDSTDPEIAAGAQRDAEVCFVPDLRTDLPYSPFLPSKFAYRIFSDSPIIVLSQPDSEMKRLADRYPDAGVFFADYADSASLDRTIESALSAVGTNFRREGIRREFSREGVVEKFFAFARSL